MRVTPVNNQYQQNFTGKESQFFKPVKQLYARYEDFFAKNFHERFFDNKYFDGFCSRFSKKENKLLFTHMMTGGAILTSGTYMVRTLNNKNLDKDRRNTLAINQGLTLGVSTGLTYLSESALNKFWAKQEARFAGAQLKDKTFFADFIAHKEEIIAKNKVKLKKGLIPDDMPRLGDFIKSRYAEKLLPEGKVLDKKARDILESKIKGMGVLKTAIIFGFIYRYFVPVVVTKPANKLGDMYLERKKAKEEAQKTQG
jgi:hypothetical protein